MPCYAVCALAGSACGSHWPLRYACQGLGLRYMLPVLLPTLQLLLLLRLLGRRYGRIKLCEQFSPLPTCFLMTGLTLSSAVGSLALPPYSSGPHACTHYMCTE